MVGVRSKSFSPRFLAWLFLLGGLGLSPPGVEAQPAGDGPLLRTERSGELRQPLRDLPPADSPSAASRGEYRVGPEDVLEITVFEAPELGRTVRVAASGEIYLPLLDAVQAAGLTPRELELVLQELLRRTYMKDPHVNVYVKEVVSHPVSVFGAVEKPGVYQLRGTKTLLEVLSMAEGLAEDAGDTVIVMRGASFASLPSAGGGQGREPGQQEFGAPGASDHPAGSSVWPEVEEARVEETIRVDLKALLEEGDPRSNIPIHPGDIVKVTRAGVVYVVGSVNQPGGFVLESNENISVLQAVARAEGTTATAAKGSTVIIRTAQDGSREEIPIDLGEILDGDEPDPMLQPNDIVFVPNSAAKSVALRGIEAVVRTVSGVIIFGTD